jgi:DNA (cytosine-5)-methyltransferase 1
MNVNRPDRIVLSLFPGVGLLDRQFDAAGFCVVRGPDLLWGGDVRTFKPPVGWAFGVLGGPPCQDFSAKRRSKPTGYGLAMLAEFRRIVNAVRPEWWLLENVARVPDVRIAGYTWQRFALDQAWFEPVSRLRHFQFGSLSGKLLDVPTGRRIANAVPAALACDDRPWPVVRALQGLPDDYDLPGFSAAGKVAAVGNGVPQCLASIVAAAVVDAYGVGKCDSPGCATVTAAAELLRCRCGCGRTVRGKQRYAGPACRKRAERRRSVAC